MEWHPAVLNGSNAAALERLSETEFLTLGDVCLVGGTAIALRLGHRVSDDLDFVYSELPSLEQARQLVVDTLGGNIIPLDAMSFKTHYSSDSKFSLIYLAARVLEAPDASNPPGVRVASLLDLMLMKLLAIYQRGTERDFVDVYFMGRLAGLHPSAVVGRMHEKYGTSDLSQRMAMGLRYFDDAESPQERPIEPLIAYSWADVRAYCEAESDRILRG